MIPKFRAWDKHTKKMFTNDQIIIWNGNVYVNDSSKLSVDRLRGWSVDGKFLMQSTGLFDKNGVEIFEGDIVHAYDECGSSLVGEVIYCDNAYCLKDNGGICNNLWINAEKYEVIGSIYQNSYLLESVEE